MTKEEMQKAFKIKLADALTIGPFKLQRRGWFEGDIWRNAGRVIWGKEEAFIELERVKALPNHDAYEWRVIPHNFADHYREGLKHGLEYAKRNREEGGT